MVSRETEVAAYLTQLGISSNPEGRGGRLLALAEILGTEGVSRGMLGPNESERILTRHVLESCALFPFINSGGRIVDVGSGAGLPGLPLAVVTDDPVTLLDSQERRVAFVRMVINRLGLENVDAVHTRAEDAGRSGFREAAGSVVARALAAPSVALELCLPLARIGGNVVLATTSDLVGSAKQRDSIGEVASELGGGVPSYVELARIPALEPDKGGPAQPRIGIWAHDESRLVVIVPKLVQTADRYPRRAGVPQRRPLG